MRLYIDIANIDSIISNRNHGLYNDLLKTMQKQLNISFNFSKDELIKNDVLMAWFKYFTAGMGENNKLTFSETLFPDRPLKSNTYIGFDKEQLSSIYLINDDRIQILKEKGAVLVGGPGEEFEVFNQIFFFHSDYKFEKKFKIGSAEFTQWNDLQNYSSAVSDILFIDAFILSDPSCIDVNFIPFLKILVNKSKCKLNIVLYVKHDLVNITYADLSIKVRQAVESVTGIKPNFTLIKVRDQRGVPSYAEHDRTIFTNYIRVYSGDTFNYFKADGSKLTKGREIHYSSFGDIENHKLALSLVDDIQNNLNELPADVAEGDKKSNFLNFK
jgi:hypothetical protein